MTTATKDTEIVLLPEGVLLVLCLTDPEQVQHAGLRDRLVQFQTRLHVAVQRRRQLGDTRRFGEIATEVCSVALIERVMRNARTSLVDGEAFLCRVLDDQIEHLG